MTARRLSPVLCLLAAFMLAGAVHADDGRPAARVPEPRLPRAAEAPPRAAPPPPAQGRSDALSDSVRRVQSHTGGQVLSAERVPYDGRDINRVKIVDERGRVRVYMDDPNSRPRRPPRPTRGDDD